MRENFKIRKEKQEEMKLALQHYFLTERGEELGSLAAEMMVDFIFEKFGPEFYNQGVNDAYAYLNDRLEDVLELQKY
ncbi:MAG TPA: DUF2164 domain-containing protein [Firmicutes bacterium]|nr:DUF2164 domain-containing protein [Bacillota bacterium]